MKKPKMQVLYADGFLNLLKYEIKNAIGTIQTIRNEASHGGNISKTECQQVRDLILGIGQESIMGALIKTGKQK